MHSQCTAGPFLVLAVVIAASMPAAAVAQDTSIGTPSSRYPGRYPYNQADIDFISGMISHHAQAIVMSKLAETREPSRQVSVLTQRIINAQQDEIVLMQTWLRDRNLPVPEAKPAPMIMKMNGVEHEMLMPGMLTDEQMKQLEAARGTEFDRLFLTFMIQHHEGAITMVNELLASPLAGQDDAIYKFLSDVFADQTAEIERMQQMLSTIQPR